MKEMVSVYRKEHFNAAHRLHNDAWDEATNDKIFGKCNNPNYHGHNYELIIKITGTINDSTGFLIDLKELSDIIEENVLQKFDHKNLNVDCKEFKNLNPTAENIAIVIYQLLRPKIEKDLDIQVRLYETERNFVEYPVSLH
ncbi:MAG: 6-carboxytetrahydropterin synthase [Bacteroidetes bacterium]|nr:6-carboxytetrahydropterin synthase [Bacteroidota bacterium]